MGTVAAALMTTEELLAMPDNGVERWLIEGQLRERPMTIRNRWHSRIEARIVQLLGNWLDQQPKPRGEIYSGEAGCRLQRNPDTTIGIDVTYVSAETAAQPPADSNIIEGIPILAVEILSPSDSEEDVNEKTDQYLRFGAIVWIVDPHFRTICVYRPGMEPELFNVRQELSAEPYLPGFRVPVAWFFECK